MIMKEARKILIPILGLAAIAVSCTETPVESPGQGNGTVAGKTYSAAKIINTPENSCDSTLLLKLESTPDEALLSELKGKGIKRVERLFTSVPGKEKKEAEFGLDKWYVAVLDEPVTTVAKSVSSIGAVSVVEYDNINTKASDCVTYPYEGPTVATKANNAAEVFNDPSVADQWAYKNHGNKSISSTAYAGGDINVLDVWTELTTGDKSIVIAVVDEGVKYTHPDLAANMWVNEKELNGTAGVDDDGNGFVDDIYGYNFVDQGGISWSKDGDSGHGTHCAGSIAAVNNNGLGVCGVAGGDGNGNGCRIMSCQIFSGKTGGSTAITSRAIKYAADNGASIISCSFGYTGGAFKSDAAYTAQAGAERDAIRYFESTKNNDVLDGGIAIFAAGNDGLAYAEYPGALNDVISVSAFGPDYLPAYYTNYGPGCNIVAPGGEYGEVNASGNYPVTGMILSTLPSELTKDKVDYGYMQGTSMACPHVSGIVGLALSYAKKLGKTFTVQEFKNMIVTSANDFDTRLNGKKTGYFNGSEKTLELYPYRHKMGTGSIDTWELMMKIEGIPSLVASVGENQWIDVSQYFGTSSANLTYISVEVEGNGKESLGLAEDPYMQYGRLYVHPTKIGSGKLKVTAVGGGTEVGGDDAIGGMKVSQEISIISRPAKNQAGGWL